MNDWDWKSGWYLWFGIALGVLDSQMTPRIGWLGWLIVGIPPAVWIAFHERRKA